MIRRSSILIFASLVFLQACASVPDQPGFTDVQSDIEERIGEDIVWERSDSSAQEAIAALATEPLTEDNAVRLALLQSPALQAEYQRLAISNADVVQAGLLTNPQFDVTSGFGPDGGATRVGAGLVYNFLELLTRRARIDAASYGFETTKAKIVSAVIAHATDVRRAHTDYVAARERFGLAKAREELAETRRQTARNLYAADEVDVSRVSLEERMYLNARADIETAKAQVVSAREALRLRIGVQSLNGLEIPDMAAAPDFDVPTLEVLSALALEWRPDLIAARTDINRLQALARQQRRGRFTSSAAAGVELEREDGENFVGPSVSLQLPVFDQGQAQIARTDALLARENYRLEQLELQVFADLRTALANAKATKSVLALQAGRQITAARANLRLSEQLFAAGETDIFEVFDAQSNLLNAKNTSLNARLALKNAGYAITTVIGGAPTLY